MDSLQMTQGLGGRLGQLLADTPPTADNVRLNMLLAARKSADTPTFYPADVVGVSMQPVSFQVKKFLI